VIMNHSLLVNCYVPQSLCFITTFWVHFILIDYGWLFFTVVCLVDHGYCVDIVRLCQHSWTSIDHVNDYVMIMFHWPCYFIDHDVAMNDDGNTNREIQNITNQLIYHCIAARMKKLVFVFLNLASKVRRNIFMWSAPIVYSVCKRNYIVNNTYILNIFYDVKRN